MPRKRQEKREFLDWRALSDFVTVVESGTMSAAASRLDLTQSAISKAMLELESDLETQLIDRSVRPVRLTRAGALLYESASRILNDVRRLRGSVRFSSEGKLPNLRVGIVESIMVTGPALIRALQKLSTEVQIVTGLTPELSRRLTQRELDVLLTSDPMDQIENIVQRTLFREPFVLVLPSASSGIAANASLKTVVETMPLVRYTTRSIIGVAIERQLRRTGFEPPKFLEFDHSTSVLDMVSAGLGCAITTLLCVLQSKIDLDTIQIRPMPGPKFGRVLYCITPGGEIPGLGDSVHRITAQCLRERIALVPQKRLAWLKEQLVYDEPQ
jgi:DNA-binding transcriptional LysR family regulator